MDHVTGYWDRRSDDNMLFLLFEDMIQVTCLITLLSTSSSTISLRNEDKIQWRRVLIQPCLPFAKAAKHGHGPRFPPSDRTCES